MCWCKRRSSRCRCRYDMELFDRSSVCMEQSQLPLESSLVHAIKAITQSRPYQCTPSIFSITDKITISILRPYELSTVLTSLSFVPTPSSCLQTISALAVIFSTHSSTSCSLIALNTDTSILAMTTPLDRRYSSRSLQNLFFFSRR